LVSPLCRTSRIGIFDHENLDLIRRSSRARYPLSPASFFRIDSVYSSRIGEPKNHHYLGFFSRIMHFLKCVCNIQCQGAERLANQGMCSLLCITW
jgi:hypothetical protein